MNILAMTAEQETKFTRETAKSMGPYKVSEDPPHYLSAVDFSDTEEMIRVINIDKSIFNGTATFQFPYLKEHADARIARAVDHILNQGINTHWAMRTSPDGPLIGWVHVYFLPDITEKHPETGKTLKIAEIGYWVSPEYSGKGYASRSARFITHEVLFKEHGCDVVRADALLENKSSRKVMESYGMQCEVESRYQYIPKHKENRLVCGYAIHQSESTKNYNVSWDHDL
ncbi:hypothetical protein BGZ76_005860 [Entomortierella beljakovae]|nr:hypothetical protein BGZ76_005860 [Entomortierella beljakovae]